MSARLLLICSLLSYGCAAQSSNALFSDGEEYFSLPPSHPYKPLSGFLPVDIWHDQKAIWTSPKHIRKSDILWLLPLAATTGLLIGTDRHEMTLIHSDAANRSRSLLFSDAGLGAFAGVTAVSYGLGVMTHDEHARETGILSTEALADSLVLVEAMKFVTDRQSPDTGLRQGLFGHASPLHSSFPSADAALAWGAAAVIAREYPGPVTQWSAYVAASLVSLSGIAAERHFPSDVLIGAAAGYLIGRYVYSTHHDDRMSDHIGSTTLSAPQSPGERRRRSVGDGGSSYVPLDSWIYPALRRLAALGYLMNQMSNMAPWTRAECLRQTREAAGQASDRGPNAEAQQLITDLIAELSGEGSEVASIRLESLYTRVTGISGTPLRDSYHFGQTISDDDGRPYDKGFNNVTGFSSSAATGPFFAYFRGEYQYAPGRDAEPLSVRQFIAAADDNPLQPANAVAATNRFEPLEMYAGVKLGFESITFGKQNLWWGPGEDSAFSFSDNAEAFYMLRFAQTRPFVLPGIFSKLGKMHTEFIFGKLSGHLWPPRVYMNAQKLSVDLTKYLEVGITRSDFFGGVGNPLTLGLFGASLFNVSSTYDGGIRDPGDRHGSFDFRYRIPGLRRYVTLYSDSYVDDTPRRIAWGPGLYVSQIPGLRRFDFRLETYATELYKKDIGGDYFYFNGDYRDSYTNNGVLLGSWIGRDSRAYIASTTYWFSAKSKVQGQFKQIKAGGHFLPGGGTQTDCTITGQWSVTPEWTIGATAQYERYYIPVLGGPQRDLLASLQVVFTPRNWSR